MSHSSISAASLLLHSDTRGPQAVTGTCVHTRAQAPHAAGRRTVQVTCFFWKQIHVRHNLRTSVMWMQPQKHRGPPELTFCGPRSHRQIPLMAWSLPSEGLYAPSGYPCFPGEKGFCGRANPEPEAEISVKHLPASVGGGRAKLGTEPLGLPSLSSVCHHIPHKSVNFCHLCVFA